MKIRRGQSSFKCPDGTVRYVQVALPDSLGYKLMMHVSPARFADIKAGGVLAGRTPDAYTVLGHRVLFWPPAPHACEMKVSWSTVHEM